MFGMRRRVWIAAFVAAIVFCVAHQRKKGGLSHERIESIQKTAPISKTTSPAPPRLAESNGTEPAFAKLLQQLSDPDAEVRLIAVEELDHLEAPDSERVSLLTACLSDTDARIRAHAALRLGSFRVAAIDAVPTLKQMQETETDEIVRARVKDALFNIRMYDYSPFMRDQ